MEDKMRKHLREIIGFFAIFLSLFGFVTAFALADDAAALTGQKLFEAKCAQCHGKDAKGAAKMVKVLKVDPSAVNLTAGAAVTATSDELVLTVTNGKKKMPKFKGKLTAEQIKSVVEYVKSLQGSTSSKDGK